MTGQEASTIHRLLESQLDPTTGQLVFTRDAGNPLHAQAVIVDETSMVDISLLAHLLQALPRWLPVDSGGGSGSAAAGGAGFPPVGHAP